MRKVSATAVLSAEPSRDLCCLCQYESPPSDRGRFFSTCRRYPRGIAEPASLEPCTSGFICGGCHQAASRRLDAERVPVGRTVSLSFTRWFPGGLRRSFRADIQRLGAAEGIRSCRQNSDGLSPHNAGSGGDGHAGVTSEGGDEHSGAVPAGGREPHRTMPVRVGRARSLQASGGNDSYRFFRETPPQHGFCLMCPAECENAAHSTCRACKSLIGRNRLGKRDLFVLRFDAAHETRVVGAALSAKAPAADLNEFVLPMDLPVFEFGAVVPRPSTRVLGTYRSRQRWVVELYWNEVQPPPVEIPDHVCHVCTHRLRRCGKRNLLQAMCSSCTYKIGQYVNQPDQADWLWDHSDKAVVVSASVVIAAARS